MKKFFILLVMIAAATLSKGLCRDSLAVFEINSTGRLVRSAPVQIPLNTQAYIGFESNNTNKALEFNQGFLIDFGGGSVAVQYQGTGFWSHEGTNNWLKRSYPNAVTPSSLVLNDGVRGPCTITFFCQNAAIRGVIYSKPDFTYASYWTRTLIKPSSSKLTVSIPNRSMGSIKIEQYGSQPPFLLKKSGLANLFVSSNQYSGVGFPGFSDGSNTNYKSSVVSWGTAFEQRSSRDVNARYLGPMTVEISYTNKNDSNNFAFVNSYVSPANYTYNTTSGVNVVKDDVSSKKQSGRLVFEKSLDQKKWLPAEDMYVTDTGGEAYYRFRLEEL